MSSGVKLTSRRVLAVVCTALLLSACGSGDKSDADTEKDAKNEASQDASPSAEPADDLVKKSNKAMTSTSFHAKGSSTAFQDARQEIWSDPDKGVRLKVTAPDVPTSELFCKDGTLYNSPQLLVAQLEQRGEEVSVPASLEDKYVKSSVPGGCDRLFTILPGATLDPELDDEVDGVKTTAVVAKSQGTTDVYQIAKEGEPLLLRMDSSVDGSKSTTVYDSYGEEMEISMPAADSVVEMKEFQKAVK